MNFGGNNPDIEIPDSETNALSGFDEGVKTAIVAIEKANRDMKQELSTPDLPSEKIAELEKAIAHNKAALISIYNIGDSDVSEAA